MARNQRHKASKSQLALLKELSSELAIPESLMSDLHFAIDGNMSEGQAAVVIKRLQQLKRQRYLNRELPDSYIIQEMKMLLGKVVTELRRNE